MSDNLSPCLQIITAVESLVLSPLPADLVEANNAFLARFGEEKRAWDRARMAHEEKLRKEKEKEDVSHRLCNPSVTHRFMFDETSKDFMFEETLNEVLL